MCVRFYVRRLSVSAYLLADTHVRALKLIKPTQLKASCYLAVDAEEVILWYTDHFGQNAGYKYSQCYTLHSAFFSLLYVSILPWNEKLLCSRKTRVK